MSIAWNDLFAALALLLVLEGAIPFLNPARWRSTMEMMTQLDDAAIRKVGLVTMIAGAILLYFVRNA